MCTRLVLTNKCICTVLNIRHDCHEIATSLTSVHGVLDVDLGGGYSRHQPEQPHVLYVAETRALGKDLRQQLSGHAGRELEPVVDLHVAVQHRFVCIFRPIPALLKMH